MLRARNGACPRGDYGMRAAILIGCSLAILNAGCGDSSAPPPVYLGHVATLSGPDKYAGEQAMRGIRLAVQEQNARAKAQNQRPLLVRHTDAQGKLEAFEGEAVRLVTINKVVALFGGTTPDEVTRMERARVPILTPLGQRTPGMSDLVFCVGLSPVYQGMVLARFIAEKNLERVTVLIDDRRSEAALVADSFVREASELKPAKDKERLQVTTRRFGKDVKLKDQAKRVDEEKPQALVYAGAPRDLLTLRQGLKTKPALFFAGEDGSVRPLIDAGNADGIHLVSAFAPDVDAERSKTFVADFRKAFSTEPDVHAALAYDSVRLFEEGFKRCEGTPERLKKEFLEIKDFPDLTGVLAVAASGRVRRPAFVIQIDHGQIKTQKQYPPED